MNGVPPYRVSPDSYQSSCQSPKRAFPPVLLGILYMVGHYVLMSAVSVVSQLVCYAIVLYRYKGGLSEDAISEKANELLRANSSLVGLITQILTVAVVVLIFLLIRAKKADAPSVLTCFIP